MRVRACEEGGRFTGAVADRENHHIGEGGGGKNSTTCVHLRCER